MVKVCFRSFSHTVELIADITGLVHSSFCLRSSGQTASTSHFLNLTVHLSFSLADAFVQPNSSPSPPLPCYSSSIYGSIFISTTSIDSGGSCPNFLSPTDSVLPRCAIGVYSSCSLTEFSISINHVHFLPDLSLLKWSLAQCAIVP